MKKDTTVQMKTDDVMGLCDIDDMECRAKSKATEAPKEDDKPKDDQKV